MILSTSPCDVDAAFSGVIYQHATCEMLYNFIQGANKGLVALNNCPNLTMTLPLFLSVFGCCHNKMILFLQ